MDTQYFKAQLDKFYSETQISVSNLVFTTLKHCQEKLDYFGVVFERSLEQQQGELVTINEEQYHNTLQELRLQIKSKTDQLSVLQEQVNNLDGEIIMEQHIVDHFQQEQVDQQQKETTTNNVNCNLFICYLCLKECKDNNNLLHHLKLHNDLEYIDEQQEQIVTTHKIENQFEQNQQYRKNRRKAPYQYYTCPDCKKVYNGHRQYRYHLRILHKKDDFFQCGYCSQGYDSVQLLSQHCIKEHYRLLYENRVSFQTQKHIYDCLYSHIEFTDQKLLANHILNTVQYHKQLPDDYQGAKKDQVQSFEVNISLDF